VTSAGASVRLVHTHGLDPRGFQTFTDIRLEGAGGDSTYGRGVAELTLSEGLPLNFAAALTLAGGSSVGGVPPQRRWYLGGKHTIRGQSPDTAQSGNAFWMTRAEIGKDLRFVRPSLFGDLGWVGDRTRMSAVGRPMSGVGVGLAVFDGLMRVDVSRGLYPMKGYRVDVTIGGRW
jgi:hemolysin activation/secretion protein